MNSPIGITGGRPALTAPDGGRGRDPASIKDVAAQFEALLLSEILKGMRKAGSGGWLDGGEDQAGATMTEMAEEQLAAALASGGGLGLARLIEQSLAPKHADAAAGRYKL